MSTLPATGVMGDLDPGHTNAQFAAEIEAFRDFVSNRPGGGPRVELTIASGAVVPGARDHGGCFTIDTQGDAATDDLDVITYTNLPNGSVIRVYAENASRVVTLKHGNGGAGEMLMTDGADFVFSAVDQWVEFQRRSTSWVESQRSYGAEGAPMSTIIYTAGGTFEKASYTGLKYVYVEVVAGGGGGGGANTTTSTQASAGAGGGGGGGVGLLIAASDLLASETVTVGAGGTASAGNTGGTGGTSSFGGHCSATGGLGGAAVSAAGAVAGVTGGNGGSGSGAAGALVIGGGAGAWGYRSGTTHSNAVAMGGSGGSGGLLSGGGGRGVHTASSIVGQAAFGYGGGGGGAANGASQSQVAGGVGRAGVVRLFLFF